MGLPNGPLPVGFAAVTRDGLHALPDAAKTSKRRESCRETARSSKNPRSSGARCAWTVPSSKTTITGKAKGKDASEGSKVGSLLGLERWNQAMMGEDTPRRGFT